VALALLGWATSAWPAPPELSLDQQRRLAAGEVVVLDALPPGASESAEGGTAVAFTPAAPKAVWAVLVDWRNHPMIYPRVVHAEVTQADARRVRMRYVLAVGILSFDLHVDKYPDAGRGRVEWRLAEDRPSRLFRESSGYWQVDAAPGGSVVTYAVATRTGVPAFFTRGAQRDSLVTTIDAVRRRAGDSTRKGAAQPDADHSAMRRIHRG
jgi:hypothetical protein